MPGRGLVRQLDDAHRRDELAPFLDAQRPQRPFGRGVRRRVDTHRPQQRDSRFHARLAPFRARLIEISRNDADRVGQPFEGRTSNLRLHPVP